MIDWYGRNVAAVQHVGGSFCLEALKDALAHGRPHILNSDQGRQLAATLLTTRLKEAGVAISMDGRDRALDNVFIERLWRSVKYEEVM